MQPLETEPLYPSYFIPALSKLAFLYSPDLQNLTPFYLINRIKNGVCFLMTELTP